MILVTGGAGFIGSHVVENLLERGEDVTVVFDKTKPGKIPHLVNKVSFVHGNIRNFEDCRRALKDVEAVIHLAALINVDHSINAPLEFYETNVKGTMNLLEAVRQEESVEKFVYMSTCEVYGNIPEGKASEDAPCNPRSPYASSKYAGERYCLSYHHTYDNPEITVIRGFNIYGPRQSYGARGAVIPIFIQKILNSEPPIIFGDGKQTRDYNYVKDLTKGIVSATFKRGIGGEIINLASGEPVSILWLANIIARLMNSPLKPVHKEGRPGELKRSCGDNSKALKLLGWKPETPLIDALKETVKFFR